MWKYEKEAVIGPNFKKRPLLAHLKKVWILNETKIAKHISLIKMFEKAFSRFTISRPPKHLTNASSFCHKCFVILSQMTWHQHRDISQKRQKWRKRSEMAKKELDPIKWIATFSLIMVEYKFNEYSVNQKLHQSGLTRCVLAKCVVSSNGVVLNKCPNSVNHSLVNPLVWYSICSTVL